MKHLWALLVGTAVGLLPVASGSADVDGALAADVAFAARADEAGHQAAFIEFLADDAVLFRPEAVRGQEWLAGHEPAGGRLEWSPAAVANDCTGRLAITTGPWRYSNADGGEPVAGHYLSVWRLNDEGQWRVVLDHGIDHVPGAQPAVQLPAAFAQLWPGDAASACSGHGEADDLAKAEEYLNAEIGRQGLAQAARVAAAEGAIAYRDDRAPGPLADLVSAADTAFGPGTAAQSVGMIFEPGTNLAVTHGLLRSADAADRALYVRVWNRERRRWQVALDVRTPLPAP
jgi:ketosteroid isomerase-like protein